MGNWPRNHTNCCTCTVLFSSIVYISCLGPFLTRQKDPVLNTACRAALNQRERTTFTYYVALPWHQLEGQFLHKQKEPSRKVTPATHSSNMSQRACKRHPLFQYEPACMQAAPTLPIWASVHASGTHSSNMSQRACKRHPLFQYEPACMQAPPTLPIWASVHASATHSSNMSQRACKRHPTLPIWASVHASATHSSNMSQRACKRHPLFQYEPACMQAPPTLPIWASVQRQVEMVMI